MEYATNDFIPILLDQCPPYSITTSISGLVYRIEILNNGALEDAIEVSCAELRMTADSEQKFCERYTQAHRQYIEKICHTEKSEEPQQQLSAIEDGYQADHTDENTLNAIYLKVKIWINSMRHHSRIFLPAVILITALLVAFLGSTLVCNEKFVSLFLSKESKIAYFKQTESFCHKLETKCINLTKINPDQTLPLSIQSCRNWCAEAIIPMDTCTLISAYFPSTKYSKEDDQDKESALNNTETFVKKEKFLMRPTGKIHFLANQYTEIIIKNYTQTAFRIKLDSISLENNIHDEIVQFRQGIIELHVSKEREKAFKVFLEPTYYKQFDKGNYAGKLNFTIYFDDEKIEKIEKLFFFSVK